MNRKTGLLAGLMIVLLSTASMAAAQSPDRFIDRWALTIPSVDRQAGSALKTRAATSTARSCGVAAVSNRTLEDMF